MSELAQGQVGALSRTVEPEYFRLRERLDAGEITQQEFDLLKNKLVMQIMSAPMTGPNYQKRGTSGGSFGFQPRSKTSFGSTEFLKTDKYGNPSQLALAEQAKFRSEVSNYINSLETKYVERKIKKQSVESPNMPPAWS